MRTDDEAMTQRRLRQANLMSAAGLVSGDDSEVIKLAQDGRRTAPRRRGRAADGRARRGTRSTWSPRRRCARFTRTIAQVMGCEMRSLALQFEVEELYSRYAALLDDGPLADWPGLFAETCFYEIMPRDNFDRGLPLAIMRCESRGMLGTACARRRRRSCTSRVICGTRSPTCV